MLHPQERVGVKEQVKAEILPCGNAGTLRIEATGVFFAVVIHRAVF
jgi:hypothetical protein